jgi:hypothetical protein
LIVPDVRAKARASSIRLIRQGNTNFDKIDAIIDEDADEALNGRINATSVEGMWVQALIKKVAK